MNTFSVFRWLASCTALLAMVLCEGSRRMFRYATLLPLTGLILGCLGEPSETAQSEMNARAPLVVTGYEDLIGTYVNASPDDGPIREVRILPCWMDISFHDGSYVAGNYSAFGNGRYFEGVLEMQASPDGGTFTHTDVWQFEWSRDFDRNSFKSLGIKTLILKSVTGGVFGTRSTLERAGDLPTAEGEDWCLSQPLPGLTQAKDGRWVFAPTEHTLDNERLVGVWQGSEGGGVKQIRILPCYLEVDWQNGDWSKGNYTAYTTGAGLVDSVQRRTGILDMDVSEFGQPQFSPDGQVQEPGSGPPAVTDPDWGIVAGIQVLDGDRLELSRGARSEPETLVRVSALEAGADARWCIPR